MGQMVVLSAEEVSKVLTIEDAIAAVEEAYRQKATGKGVAWPMVYEQFEPGVADMDIRSGELAGSGLFGLKLTAWFSQNPKKGPPRSLALRCCATTRRASRWRCSMPPPSLGFAPVPPLRSAPSGWLGRMRPNCLLRVPAI